MIVNQWSLDITESDFNTCLGVKNIHLIHIWVGVGRSVPERSREVARSGVFEPIFEFFIKTFLRKLFGVGSIECRI